MIVTDGVRAVNEGRVLTDYQFALFITLDDFFISNSMSSSNWYFSIRLQQLSPWGVYEASFPRTLSDFNSGTLGNHSLDEASNVPGDRRSCLPVWEIDSTGQWCVAITCILSAAFRRLLHLLMKGFFALGVLQKTIAAMTTSRGWDVVAETTGGALATHFSVAITRLWSLAFNHFRICNFLQSSGVHSIYGRRMEMGVGRKSTAWPVALEFWMAPTGGRGGGGGERIRWGVKRQIPIACGRPWQPAIGSCQTMSVFPEAVSSASGSCLCSL